MRSREDQELAMMLRERLGFRRYWFWTLAAKVLPARVLCWLLARIPGEEEDT